MSSTVPFVSYHGDPAVKAKYQARFAAHRAADQVIQGLGFEKQSGCFVGCTLDDYDHSRFPAELGWPVWLAHLSDYVFEGIPKAEAAQFGTDILAAVPVGVDLAPVKNRFLLTAQRRNLARIADNPANYADVCRAAVRAVIDLLDADEPDKSAAESAAAAAWSAAEAAESAAESAAAAAWSAAAPESERSAAESAAWSAERSAAAESAERSAAESAERSAERSAEWRTQRDDLLAILRECGSV